VLANVGHVLKEIKESIEGGNIRCCNKRNMKNINFYKLFEEDKMLLDQFNFFREKLCNIN
jgi:hypothetical protein